MATKIYHALTNNKTRGFRMKQLTVISGKGGTGKTSITAAFAALAHNAVFADCDVDAADLHLILKPTIKETRLFSGLQLAVIDENRCTHCGTCKDHCVFQAIDKKIHIIKASCEGCGVCAYVCPEQAITMKERESGYAYQSETRFGPLSHATLKTAEEASGKLVTLVRDQATTIAEQHQKDLILIDGPPGIGCPVISSITGVDMVLIVTEPTLSAIHDLKRILGVADHFHIPALVCINKYDINIENTTDIETFCEKNNRYIVGKIPYDPIVTQAMIHEQAITEYQDHPVTDAIAYMWKSILEKLKE